MTFKLVVVGAVIALATAVATASKFTGGTMSMSFTKIPVTRPYATNTARYSLFPPSGAGAFTTSCTKVDGAIRDRDAERGADCSRYQADFTAVCAHQFSSDRQT